MVLGIYCPGGLGGCVLELAKFVDKDKKRWNEYVFITDVSVQEKKDIRICFYDEFKKEFPPSKAEILIASGEPQARELLYEKVKADGYSLPNLIHPTSIAYNFRSIGEGNIIQDYVHFSPSNVTIGNNNCFMTFCRIAHDSIVGNNCVFSASSNCSGHNVIGNRCYIGTGAKTRENISIGDDAIIGMGSIVLGNVLECSVVVGNPAKEIRKNTGRVFKK